MSTNNPWQLYSTVHGWQSAAEMLSMELDVVLLRLDNMVATGTPISLAANAMFNVMAEMMSKPEFSRFGADDSEPRSYLAHRLTKHMRETHKARLYVDRWGGVGVG